MNLIEFIEEYPYEASCRAKFKEYREHVGVVSPKCGNKTHYWKQDKASYECKECRHRQSLRTNTVMHKLKLPFRYWFIAMHLLTSTKKSFSGKELQLGTQALPTGVAYNAQVTRGDGQARRGVCIGRQDRVG
jgi:hypothetical protein